MRMKFSVIIASVFCWVLIFTTGIEAANLRKGPYIIYTNLNTQMKVLWQADETPTDSQIEWGRTTSYQFASGPLSESGSAEDEHQFSHIITDLKPSTRYYYRVSVDIEQATGSFMTAPPNSASAVTIYGYGDTQSHPDDHDRVVKALLADVDTNSDRRQTITLHSGDWVSDGDDEEVWDGQYFSREYDYVLNFLSRIAVMGGRGNHEGSAVLFRKYWPYDYQDSTGCYYSFDYGPLHVAVVDQYVLFFPESPQYKWLANDLENTQKPWKFVTMHKPAWSAGGDHDNDYLSQLFLDPLFEEYGVAVVHAGHNHYYARCEKEGVQHITSGGGGGRLNTPDPGYPYVVMSDESNHFIRYEIVGSKMTVTAIRDDGSVIESFELGESVPEIKSMPWIPLLLLDND